MTHSFDDMIMIGEKSGMIIDIGLGRMQIIEQIVGRLIVNKT